MMGSTHTPIPCPPSTHSTRGRQEDTVGTEAAPLHNPALFTPLYKTIFPALFYKATPGRGERGDPTSREHPAAHPPHGHPVSPPPGPQGGGQRWGEPQQGEQPPRSCGELRDGAGGL